MKKLILSTCLLLFGSAFCFSQCENNFIINSSKTEYLDADSSLQRTVDENTVIEVSRPNITITPAGKKMSATIASETCHWKIPFVEGITILKATFTDEKGDAKNATITIVGKEGKLMLWLSAVEMPVIIRVPIDKFL